MYLQGSDRSRTSPSLSLGQSLFIEVSSLSSISKLGLSLTEFGQVECSNLFSFLNLLLVRLDLRLKLIDQSLHALMVLPILIRSIGHLLDASLRLAQVLASISTSTGFSINFRFQFANSSLHLVHSLLTSLQSIRFCFIKTLLDILDLTFKEFAISFISKGNFLLHSEFISQPSSINHSLLCLLIRKMSLAGHFIKISMKGLHLGLQFPLSSSNGLVGASQVRKLFISVRELLLRHAASTISLLEQCTSFFKSILSSIGPTLIGKEVVTNDLLVPLFLLKLSLSITNLSMILLDCLLGVSIGCIGMLQC